MTGPFRNLIQGNCLCRPLARQAFRRAKKRIEGHGANGEMLDHIAQARPAKRRFTMEAMNQIATPLTSPGLSMPMSMPQPRRTNSEMLAMPENMEGEYTVRGRLHWIDVIRDWNWESKLIFTFAFCVSVRDIAACGLLLTSHFSFCGMTKRRG